ncbi:DUF192 domain-containing protein [Halococcoides cellulosivorans]|uniref:DUF192 domain-containing protein n=1 Tax=Halococcoides cellulosivorans TaxID=1679096 RepID=A0A2R4X1M2_9EURY|nr:DUF192 domain-containing protein [Halococcoides cellulosivorans]AWB27697.1 DUF192 domain-containing protein [Halococcoides cellulosivorans]
MDRRRAGQGLVIVGALAVATLLLVGSLTGAFSGRDADWETVTIESDGERLATVDVRVADDHQSRYIGLSETDHLGPREGMLFVHSDSGPHEYVMRDMAFPLDIVFVDANGTITAVHEAPVPEGSYDRTYEGRGRYVLELNRGTMAEVGAGVGDRVVIPNGTA